MELISRELGEIEKLWAKNLVPLSKLISTQRDAARIEGERAQLIAAAAQAKGKIAETELQIIQVDQDMRTEVMKDLREIQAKNAELIERRVAAEDQLKRIDIRAPQSGIVHQLAVHTVGGVINPGEPIMLIVPEGDALVIEAKIAPQDIDHVRPGQQAFVRFTAFNQRTTPEFRGEVLRVAADLTKEAQTNQAYFLSRIALSEAELKRLGHLNARARHARRGVHQDHGAHRDLLSPETAVRPGGQGLHRALDALRRAPINAMAPISDLGRVRTVWPFRADLHPCWLH